MPEIFLWIQRFEDVVAQLLMLSCLPQAPTAIPICSICLSVSPPTNHGPFSETSCLPCWMGEAGLTCVIWSEHGQLYCPYWDWTEFSSKYLQTSLITWFAFLITLFPDSPFFATFLHPIFWPALLSGKQCSSDYFFPIFSLFSTFVPKFDISDIVTYMSFVYVVLLKELPRFCWPCMTSLPKGTPVLPIGGLWSLTISPFSLPMHWGNFTIPHGTICRFCQLLISLHNMSDNFFSMSYPVSLTSVSTKLVFSFSYTLNSTEVQSSLRDVLKAKRYSKFPE